MVSICPTITATDTEMFRTQIEQIALLATRIHIDVSDGIMAPTKLLELDKIWWPGGMRADLHVMLEDPFKHTDLYRALGPQMVIVHAEAKGDFIEFAETMRKHGIETGVALLPKTKVETIIPAMELINHVLIFSGKLGSFGGTADLKLLDKVKKLRAAKPSLEIGWDGGINDQNVRSLMDGGVDVMNVGGFIHRAPDPAAAYQKLLQLTSAETVV
jgi:ribulose-phosphate 3-epimerase